MHLRVSTLYTSHPPTAPNPTCLQMLAAWVVVCFLLVIPAVCWIGCWSEGPALREAGLGSSVQLALGLQLRRSASLSCPCACLPLAAVASGWMPGAPHWTVLLAARSLT